MWLVLGGCGSAVLAAAFLTEIVMTCFFLIVILGATSKRAAAGFAPIAIGGFLFPKLEKE